MTRRIAVVLLVLVSALQLGVPVAMIARREITRVKGESFRFRCAPVDPIDPFRGRYVAVHYDAERYEGPIDWKPYEGQTVFARIEIDEDGFARVGDLSPTRPARGVFVRSTALWSWRGDAIFLEFPFDRYYMEETKAPEAAALYAEAAGDQELDAWADVRILDGYAVLEELYVDGIPLEDHFRGNRKSSLSGIRSRSLRPLALLARMF